MRMACYQKAGLTLLDGEHRTIPCFAVRLSGCALRIVLDEVLPLNVPVAIETGDWIALGETSSCQREYAHYAVEVELDEFVGGIQELDALRRNRLQERPTAQILSLSANIAEQPVAELQGSPAIRRNH